MDFISASFPDTKVHLCLYKLSVSGETPEALTEKKSKLAHLMGQYRSNFTIVNVDLLASIMHLNIAISRALLNKRDGKFKTESLGNEIVYYCDPQHSINLSLQNYGLKNCHQAFFAVFVDFPDAELEKLKAQLSELTDTSYASLNAHLEFQDSDKLVSIFKLNERERALPNSGILTSIYTKLALKGL